MSQCLDLLVTHYCVINGSLFLIFPPSPSPFRVPFSITIRGAGPVSWVLLWPKRGLPRVVFEAYMQQENGLEGGMPTGGAPHQALELDAARAIARIMHTNTTRSR